MDTTGSTGLSSLIPRDLGDTVRAGLGLIVGALALMWGIEVVDTFALSDRLEAGGIVPRRRDGIDGVLWAPFLHGGFAHLISNTIPFAILGALVMVRGVRAWLSVTAIVVLVGGFATWLLARTGNHIGASGVVFGYFGFLIGAAVFERKLRSILTAVVAVVLYGSLVFGFLPQPGVSFEGHLFGAAAGGLAANVLTRRGASD